MNVELLNATQKPERLVCTAARNDYRSDGVIGQSHDEIMASADGDTEDLLDHLMRSGHWGPFEHPQATIAIEGVSRVMMAQITRHRHFTFDIMSLRYVDVDGVPRDVCYVPPAEDLQASRGGTHDVAPDPARKRIVESYERSIEDYRELLDTGCPPEEARRVLPLGTRVNIVMSGNARAWMHALKVRTKADVQAETRKTAEGIFDELRQWMPHTFERYDEMLPMELGP